MKITSFYYLEYPDNLPDDPKLAASEVYVEVAIEDGSTDNFDFAYALTVCTVEYLQQYLKSHPFFVARSLIVVEKFEDKLIKNTLDSLLPQI